MKYNKNMLNKEIDRSRFAIQWGGVLGMIAHPVYYFVWTVLIPQPYDNFFLRISAAVLCIPLVLHQYWPQRLQSLLIPYWHFFLTYALPFVCTFLAIKNGFSTMWMMTEVMIIFVMALCIDSPRLLMIYVVVGMASATGAAVLTSSVPIILSEADKANLALFPIVTACSMIFSRSKKMGHLFAERNKLLQALAGSIAHEMRNPLSQIKSSLDGIEKSLPIPTTEAVTTLNKRVLKSLYDYVAIGESAIKRGLQVIAMILDEVKDKSIDQEQFNYLHAAQATQKAIAEYGYETEGERHKISFEVKHDFIFKGDETLYLFVLFNLIKNALYYFKLDSQAKLVITVDQSSVIVRDTGPGIEKEILPYLFDSFQTSGKQGGTGLGLAYCKRVMQAFGGDIRCQSVLGKYTEFVLSFPEVSTSTWQQYQIGMIERLRPLLCDKKVLVVDDDETIRASTQKVLRDLGIQADYAENGQQALQQLEQTAYDLMLLDLNMPVLNGYATAEKIRSGVIAGYEQIPIIAYTTEVAYMAQVKTQKVGINAFISKPCEPLVLMQTMEQVLTQKPLVNALSDQATNTLSLLYGKTVLITDDSETNRELIKYALEKKGIHILEAAHGQAAIDQLEQHPECAAVLMDIHMPGLNGLEASRLIRNQVSRYQAIPIIAITGDTDKESMTAAFACGIDDYIVKPIDSRLLLNKLSLLCNSEQEKISAISLFDFERLDHFKKSGIFKDGVDNSYVRQTTEHLMVLEDSLKSQDFERIQDALHFLKGSSFTIGAKAFAHLIKNYEQQTKKGDLPDDEYWFEKVKSLHGRTLEALQAHFSRSS